MKLLVLISILISLSLSGHASYMLIEIRPPESDSARNALLELGLDIVNIDHEGNIEIVVRSEDLERMEALGISYTIRIQDMEAFYANKMSGVTNFGGYYTCSESNSILDSLHARFPAITSGRIDLGYATWDNNRVYAFKVSDNPNQQEDEPEILFTGVHHAREPITVNMCVELIRLFCENYATDPEITHLVDNRQIWVVPVMNPDGYLYNEMNNPNGGGMWRKNRRDNGNGVYGVDPNRNYAYQWGYDNYGSSPDPGAETYRGPAAFSEPETQAIQELFNGHQFIANVDFHSYGNYILYPWGYRVEYTPDDSLFQALSADMRDLAVAATGQTYIYGIPPQVLYAVNGSSDDWEYGEQSSKPKCLGFTFEFGEAFWQESEIDDHLAEGLPMCMYLIKIIGPWIEYADHIIDDGASGNDTLDPGETVTMIVTLANKGITGSTINNVNAILSSDDNFITILADSGYFGNIAPGSSGQNSGTPYSVHAHDLTPEGHVAAFTLSITGSDGFCGTSSFKVRVGAQPPEYMIFADDFEYGSGIDSFLNYWDKTGNWQWSTGQSHSPTHSAYSGTLVNGTVSLTLNNAVDITLFNNPQLIYWDRWNWDNGFWTDAWVDVSTNNGSTWTAIWTLPSNPSSAQDWTEKSYSLDSYVSSNFKVRFRLYSYDFFQDFNDWWIDDFRISVPTDNAPPYFANTTVWPDTTFAGPFPVQSTVTDQSGIDEVRLYYRVNSGTWQSLQMSHQGGSVYQTTIPQQNMDDTIDYYLWGCDTWIDPNQGTDPVGAPGSGYYSFAITVIGVAERRSDRVWFGPVGPNPTKGSFTFQYNIPRQVHVSCRLYDVTGRLVETLIDNTISPGEYACIWDGRDAQGRPVSKGIYFAKFTAGQYETIEKIVYVR